MALFLLLLVVGTIDIIYYYPRLPETVASHFDASGKPDGWSTKKDLVEVFIVVTLSSAFLFLGIALGLPKLPDSLINLPKKEYWLAPERRQETLSFISGYLLWFGIATLGLLICVMHQTFRANLSESRTLENVWFFMGAYLVFLIIWVVGLLYKFFRTPT
jgi:uncharacterized membrane protein